MPTTYYLATPADITPHLIPDIHPWWVIGGYPAANPIWQDCGTFQPYHNWLLYSDPTTNLINPPGSYIGNGTEYVWLEWITALGTPTPSQFGPFATSTAPTAVANFGTWCQNAGGTVPYDTLGGLPNGWRFSLEHRGAQNPSEVPFGEDHSNLQSFMLITTIHDTE